MGDTTKIAALAVAGAILLCATGCTSEPGAAEGSSAGMPLADYQRMLTGVEQTVRPAVERMLATGTVAELTAARKDLQAVLDQQRAAVAPVKPPTEVGERHQDVLTALGATRIDVPVNSGVPPNICGIPTPEIDLASAKLLTYRSVELPGWLEAGLTNVGLRFGAEMLPPPPVIPPPPPELNRRARNGEIVQRAGRRGSGELLIRNGSASDYAVSAVTGNPAIPQATIYVHANSNTKLTGLSGTYEVYLKSGVDWDAGRRGFTRGCGFEKFDEPFHPSSNWEIELQTTERGDGGAAATSSVPPF
ncbi:hypothetical protein EV193_111175 [Herbihabitans rhizosphaerae]|uniref:Uncharacterized protein n=1 Tax=Herbihabitans rhizosphaerae TaxID=1872711 RepID=A0A4Q7KFP8_9PSEU|nr:hypothetical protein [Herbihabitans rhizosphaerae]RZS32790.1 hypothetical protein EV193_111175 [Herbihabitans rhizosphaerae]